MKEELAKVIEAAHESYISVEHSPGGVSEFEYITQAVLQSLASVPDEEVVLTTSEIDSIPTTGRYLTWRSELLKAQLAKAAPIYAARAEKDKQKAVEEAEEKAYKKGLDSGAAEAKWTIDKAVEQQNLHR